MKVLECHSPPSLIGSTISVDTFLLCLPCCCHHMVPEATHDSSKCLSELRHNSSPKLHRRISDFKNRKKYENGLLNVLELHGGDAESCARTTPTSVRRGVKRPLQRTQLARTVPDYDHRSFEERLHWLEEQNLLLNPVLKRQGSSLTSGFQDCSSTRSASKWREIKSMDEMSLGDLDEKIYQLKKRLKDGNFQRNL